MKIAFLFFLSATAFAQTPSVGGISLHDTKMAVQSKLRGNANFQREEEGQQIWAFEQGAIQSLIIGFDGEGRVRFVTSLGRDVPCEPLGASPKSLGKTPELTFQREMKNLVVIAHGADLAHLHSCSLKDPHTRMADPDKEEDKRK